MSHATLLVAVSPNEIKKHGSVEKAVEWNMEPFNENGKWFKDGSRWDFYSIGGRYSGRLLGHNILRRDQMDEQQLMECTRKRLRDHYQYLNMPSHSSEVACDETEDEFVDRMAIAPLTAHAFLRSRQWHENNRLGWFGASIQSETQPPPGEPSTTTFGDKNTSSAIVTYGLQSERQWKTGFWERFVRDLPGDITLVMVDYHV